MPLDPETIRRLARLTLETRPHELSCEDWIHRVGEYVEATRSGAALDERLRLVEQHAAECPSCEEELETLRRLLNESTPDEPGDSGVR